jgi:hypothetical protein
MTELQIKEMEQKLAHLAETHHCQMIVNTEDEMPCFTFDKCNVPLLADVRMTCEEYGVQDCVESSDSWGYVGVDLNNL